jgi:NTE family protein
VEIRLHGADANFPDHGSGLGETGSRRSPAIGTGMGLVLSAGGARGAYQLGCWKAFLEKELTFNAIAGSSIGALNGALMCQGDWDAAHRVWLELAHAEILQPDYRRLARLAATVAADLGLLFLPVPKIRLLRVLKYTASAMKFVSRHGSLGKLLRDGIVDIRTLQPILDRHLDMGRVLKASCALYVTAVGAPRVSGPMGVGEVFRLQSHPEDEAWNILGASMAVPMVFSSVEMQGRRLSDGGLAQWLPVEPLYRAGFRDLVVVSTKASPRLKVDDYPNSRIILIKPEKPLGRFPIATFRFTEEAVERWTEQGYLDASRALTRL